MKARPPKGRVLADPGMGADGEAFASLGFFAFQHRCLNFPNTASHVVRLPVVTPALVSLWLFSIYSYLGGWGTSPGCSLVPGHPHPQGSTGHPRPGTKPPCLSSSPSWEMVLYFQGVGWRDADLEKTNGKIT